jgi:hypothetical protein
MSAHVRSGSNSLEIACLQTAIHLVWWGGVLLRRESRAPNHSLEPGDGKGYEPLDDGEGEEEKVEGKGQREA